MQFDWAQRPLTQEQKKIAACHVAFLIKLYLHMVHNILLRPLSTLSQEYSATYLTNNDTVGVIHEITTKKNRGVDKINENALETFENSATLPE